MRIQLTPQGAARQSRVVSAATTLPSQRAVDCMLAATRRWRYPPTAGSADRELVVPFHANCEGGITRGWKHDQHSCHEVDGRPRSMTLYRYGRVLLGHGTTRTILTDSAILSGGWAPWAQME